MFFDLLILGGLAFWLFMLVMSIIFIACVEYDSTEGATIFAVLASIGILVVASDLPFYVQANWWLLACIPAWFLIGIVWSFPRWVIFLRRGKRDYLRAVADFCAMNKLPFTHPKDMGIQLRKDFVDSGALYELKRRYGLGFDFKTGMVVPPLFKDNSDRLVAWILLWLWSMIWTLCRDGIVRLTEVVVDWLGKAYQRLSDWVYKDT